MNGFYLKIIAIISMSIDHTAIILSMYTNTIAMRYVGRIAFPLFAFLIAEGCFYTKSIKKYMVRLLTFGVISQVPFTIFNGLSNPFIYLNVFFTLTLGVLCIFFHQLIINLKLNILNKNILFTIICILILLLSEMLNVDYGAMGVIIIYCFYLCISSNTSIYHIKQMQSIAFIIFMLIMYPPLTTHNTYMFLVGSFALIPILLYNGQKGKSLKYFFYIFYPIHLLILACIRHYFL